MSFQDAAIESARLYYNYLENSDGGLIEYHVSKIIPEENSFKKNEYWLQLDKKVNNADSLTIRVKNYTYNREQIKPTVFDSQKHLLKVSLSENIKGIVEHCAPEDIIVFSDLKFLVRRVETWYRRYGSCIMQPKGKQTVKEANCRGLKLIPSTDQITAIRGALATPFSYIWGAPGTGKTQLVLARTVLAYIQEGKRILVTAPTNNAVEQTLYGLLPVLAEAGLDYNKLVIRLGTATTAFLAQFPGVCEDSAYSKAISDIMDRISSLQSSLDQSKQEEKLYYDFLSFQEKRSGFENETAPLKELLPQLMVLSKEVACIQADLDDKLTALSEKETEQKDNDNSQAFYSRQAKDLIKRMNNPIYAILPWFNMEEEQKKVAAALEKARNCDEKRASLEIEKERLSEKVEELQTKLTDVRAAFEKTILEVSHCAKSFKALWETAKKIHQENAEESIQQFQAVLEREKQAFLKEAEKYASVANRSLSSFAEEQKIINQHVWRLEQKKEELDQTDLGKREEECLVVACTIDTCLNRIPITKKGSFAHVFLDEAGYSSLIKAATLTAFGEKLTFLGDHMQLSPVCEANDNTIKQDGNLLLAFWAQSALFVETIFSEPADLICKNYLEKAKIPFRSMKKYELISSHRFGEDLARVLAADVYGNQFHGNDGHNTRIYYIDAPKRVEQETRVSHSECEQIERLLQKYSKLKEATGIIAPYNNQVKLLKKMAKRCRFPIDSVVTVHQSQGREWDNVFLSVTDTVDMFFTDSFNTKSDGKKVINTAVSRAKKNLVIVCDYHYWINQRSQLIGKLLAVAKELPSK